MEGENPLFKIGDVVTLKTDANLKINYLLSGLYI